MQDCGPDATAIGGVGQSIQSAGQVDIYVGILDDLSELVEGETDVALLTGIGGFTAEFQGVSPEVVFPFYEVDWQANGA